jgi:O-antigen/teichoic acid export membrane protein
MLPRGETRAVVANYAHLASSALVFILLTPIILGAVGATAYGYWAILNSLGGYLLLADLGLSAAVARYAAMHRSRATSDSLNLLLSTIAAPMAAIVGCVIAATFLAAPVVTAWFHVPADLESSVQLAFVLTGINAAALLLTLFVSNINYGCGRLDVSKGSSIAGQVVMGAATVVLVRAGYGVEGLAAATLAGTVVSLGLNLAYLRHARPDIAVNPFRFDASVLADVGGYSFRTFILGATARLVYYTDAVVIGAFLGAPLVASYELTYKLCFFATYLSSSISTAAFPRFSSWSSDDGCSSRRRDAYLQVVRLSMLVAVPVGICLAAFARPFLTIWAGPSLFAGAAVLAVLMAMHVIHAVGTPAVMFLQSAGRNRELTYAEVANAALNLGLSILLVRRFGIAGVAAATLIAQLCTSLWITQLLPARMLGLSLADYVATSILLPIAIGIPAALGALLMNAAGQPFTGLPYLVAGGIVVFALYGATYAAVTRLTSGNSPWLIESVS